MKKEISFSEQNKNNKLFNLNGKYYLKNQNLSWEFGVYGVPTNDVIHSFIDIVYFFNDYNIVLLHKEKTWYRYVYDGKGYTLNCISPYMILSHNKKILCSIKYNGVIDNYLIEMYNFLVDDYGLKLKNTIFTGTNLLFNDNKFVMINNTIKRKLTFDKNNKHHNRIIMLDTNNKKYPKITIYTDNIGGIDIYNDKGKLIYESNKFYWINKNNILIKKQHKYVLLCLLKNKEIYECDLVEINNGSDYINMINHFYNEIAVIDKKTSELFIYDKEIYSDIINNKDGKMFKKHIKLK